MKTILIFLTFIVSLFYKPSAPTIKSDVYAMGSRCISVEAINNETDLVTVENCNEQQYAFYSDTNDYFPGDDISCVMDGMGTPEVYDDIIISVYNDRYDMLP